MQCVEVRERLLAGEPGYDPEIDQHVADCQHCRHIGQGLDRVDQVLRSSLIVEPPLALQQQLARLAWESAIPASKPWWAPVTEWLGHFNVAAVLAQRPQMVAAQGLAALMIALASWQMFSWLSAVQPVVGDVAYAMQLVATSPAISYVGNLQVDMQSLGLWSLVGIAGWLVSEDGLIGRRIASTGLRLP